MGVLNVTPNSFSDAKAYLTRESALRRALEMVAEGATIIDVGGEASNPGAEPISLDEELDRVIPVIEAIRNESDICISIDTYKSEVMRKAVHAGASMINDIMALQGDGSIEAVKELAVPVCLMHMQGTPITMQQSPQYEMDVVECIHQFFIRRIEECIAMGINPAQLMIDPGIGFGKSIFHNLEILQKLSTFTALEYPVLIGVSRKSMIGEILKKPVNERMIGSVAVAVYAQLRGVKIIRTHDVDETSQALRMISSILQ